MSRMMSLAWSLAMAGIALAAEVTLEPDRMAVVDGKRTFILGLYENPKDDADLDAVAKAGFNLVQSTDDTGALDRLHKRGLHAWVNLGGRIDLSVERESREQALRELATGAAGKHPALLCWEVPDEALWNCWYGPFVWRTQTEPKQQRDAIEQLTDEPLRNELAALRAKASDIFSKGHYAEGEQLANEIWARLGKPAPQPDYNVSNASERAAKMLGGMRDGYALLKELDPSHPIWMNHAPRNQIGQLAAYGEAADVVGCDIYPIPENRGGHSDLSDRMMTSVGAYTLRMQASAPGKPVWMVLQGFGWPDIQDRKEDEEGKIPRPNRAQLRFMCYETIVHGGRGILFWGTFAIEKDSQLWKDVLGVTRELADLQPVLSAPEATWAVHVSYDETMSSLDKGIVVLPKLVNGKPWLIIVNECTDPLSFRLVGMPAGHTLYRDASTQDEFTAANGSLSLIMAPREVRVLESR